MKSFIFLFSFLLPIDLFALPPLFGFCRDSDKDCIQALIDKSPSKNEQKWLSHKEKPLEDRIFFADKEDIEYLRLVNRIYEDGIRAQTSSSERLESFLPDVKQALTTLPEFLKKKIEQKLLGIVIAEQTGATATCYLDSENMNKNIAM